MESLFLTNYTEVKFLNRVRSNLKTCKAFYFSVSFIKMAGLRMIFKDIEDALKRGATGRIITSTYKNFTDIVSLNKFLSLMEQYDNFCCHLDNESFIDNEDKPIGYHSKGYLFDFYDSNEIIVGSSNLTRSALEKNIEWDLVLKEKKLAFGYSKTFNDAKQEFDTLWNDTILLDKDVISKYELCLNFAIENWSQLVDYSNLKILPNQMQKKALKELSRYRKLGIQSSLVIAAAGSGKTFLAAFDAFNFNPKKLLYVVHETTILRKAMKTFKQVFGDSRSIGEFSGNKKLSSSDFLFATNITLKNHLKEFSRDAFDYIIIDEVHHAPANTYQEIIKYFKPKFLLGLTATPERMDDKDVFDIFDGNVPYELRLRDAIINDIVVPFRYFAVKDNKVDYDLTISDIKSLGEMTDDEHIDFIKNEIDKTKTVDGKLKGLVFCRNVQHAKTLSEKLSKYYHTAYLTAKNSPEERTEKYSELQSDKQDLELLFTVDILNEGVDIPAVNTVLFLRPTDSSIVFIQQLGRGLRKYEGKEYVTVLDFIGNNYKRSVQIAMGLAGLGQHPVMDKKLLKDLIKDDFKPLGLTDYGVQIHLEEESKQDILSYIDATNFTSLKILKQDYLNFKKFINPETYPKHVEYLNNEYAPDLIKFINAKSFHEEGSSSKKKNGSYYNFLRAIGEENLPYFDTAQVNVINYISGFLPIVRKYEYIIFDCILRGKTKFAEIEKEVRNSIQTFDIDQYNNAIKYIKEEKSGVFIKTSDNITFNCKLNFDFIDYCNDLIEYGLCRFDMEFIDDIGFKLWHTYRTEQVLMKINKNPNANQKGTNIIGNKVYLFVNLKKGEKISKNIDYIDKYLSLDVFQWDSVHDIGNKELKDLINSKEVYLFVRKNKDEDGITQPFIYAGKGKFVYRQPFGQYIKEHKLDIEDKKSWVFKIQMEEKLPDYLKYDLIDSVDRSRE